MQLTVKAILNAIQHFSGFVYQDIKLERNVLGGVHRIQVSVAAHAGSHPKCSRCQQPAPGYDTLAPREWLFPPLWNIPTCFLYAAR